MSAETLTRIATAMGCAPADGDDLVEAVRLLVAERDEARAELEATERARQAAEEERDTVLELVADDAVAVARERDDRDAARLHAVATLRVALSDAEADRDKALAAVAAERTRREAAEASATRSADAAVDAVRELGHVAAAAVTRADAAEAEVVRLRVALADTELILEARERQLTAALTAVAEERVRCASVCREVACFYDPGDVGSVVALACADEIERESALLRTPGA